MKTLYDLSQSSLLGPRIVTRYLDDSLAGRGNYYFSDRAVVRMNFLLVAIGWNPIQAIGHLALRVHYICSGKFLLQAEIYFSERYAAFLINNKTGFKRSLLLLSIYDLADKVSGAALFILFGVLAREVVAIAGILFPVTMLPIYIKIDDLFKLPSRKNLQDDLTVSLDQVRQVVLFQSAHQLFLNKLNAFTDILRDSWNLLSIINRYRFKDLLRWFQTAYNKHGLEMSVVGKLLGNSKRASTPEEERLVNLYRFLEEVTQAFQVVKTRERDLAPHVVKTLLDKKAALHKEFGLSSSDLPSKSNPPSLFTQKVDELVTIMNNNWTLLSPENTRLVQIFPICF